MKGNGLQNGGMIIVRKGGCELLLHHIEEVPGSHVPNDSILSVLGINAK